jgi:outer membrane protein TolC
MVAQQDLEKRKEDIAFEVSTAETAVQQSVVQWNKAQANLAAGRQLFALDRERFAQGKLTYSELLNTDYALREAERNALSAWYNYLLARARWERAAGI